MASTRIGFTDSYQQSRLQHVNGTSYPTAPTGTYLAIYAGAVPDSSGNGGTEATGTRPAVTFGSPQVDVNGHYYIANSSAVSGIAMGNASQVTVVGFGIYTASTGGTPLYVGRFASPYPVAANAPISIPIGLVKMFAEGHFS